jgi:hypothetical protein
MMRAWEGKVLRKPQIEPDVESKVNYKEIPTARGVVWGGGE